MKTDSNNPKYLFNNETVLFKKVIYYIIYLKVVNLLNEIKMLFYVKVFLML
uniref:Uncharacterized protein n=1 Tax=Candidatus Phytoplasma australasiaticum subsp. australasiaticum TaxID=2832407 RepID=A0A7S7FZ84_9MOLU|nr:hypothetical protein H7685_02175 ['Parthenium hysterophorus' phyllody phytoplasma]